jgi:tetratricopeptide (TPR) repeat protein
VHALDGLATAFYQQGRYDEALKFVSRAIDLDPINPRLFHTKAQILDAQDQPLKAVEAYLTFSSLNPDDSGVVPAMRRVDELQKRVEPQLNEAWRNYLNGLRMLSLHQPDQAIPMFERFQTLEPGNLQPNLLLGRAYLEMGQPSKAIPFFQTALKLQADNPMAYYQLGSSYELNGQTQQARDAWKKFLQFAPQSETALTINRRFDITQK